MEFNNSLGLSTCLVGKKVAVIGASGYIGSHVVDMFLSEKCFVYAFSRNLPGLLANTALANPNLLLFDLDISDKLAVDSSLVDIDIVIHLASSTLPYTSNLDPTGDINSNLIGALNVLNSAIKNKVKKFIFISSGGTIYGRPSQVPIPETHATDPICSYGIVKLAIEKYIGFYGQLHNIHCTILRLANPYGGRQKLHSGQGVVPAFLSRALDSQTLEVWGDGSIVRDFLYISDVIKAIKLACSYYGDQLVFNIGSGSGLSILELIELIQSMLDHPLELIFKEPRSFDVPTNVLSIEKARRDLNWVPQVSPVEGLKLFYHQLSRVND